MPPCRLDGSAGTANAGDAQHAAFDARGAEIRALAQDDLDGAATAAIELVEQHGGYRGEAARLRADLVLRIYEGCGRSPTAASRRLHITKQRVSGIIRRGRGEQRR